MLIPNPPVCPRVRRRENVMASKVGRRPTPHTWEITVESDAEYDFDFDLTVTRDGIQIDYGAVIPWAEIDEARKRAEADESCARCGVKVTPAQAVTDQGEGEEAGRTFTYCSYYCRDTH